MATTLITLSPDDIEAICQRAADLALLKAARQSGEQWTPQDVAAHFQISTRTVRNWEIEGKIPARRNGRWAKAEILQNTHLLPKK